MWLLVRWYLFLSSSFLSFEGFDLFPNMGFYNTVKKQQLTIDLTFDWPLSILKVSKAVKYIISIINKLLCKECSTNMRRSDIIKGSNKENNLMWYLKFYAAFTEIFSFTEISTKKIWLKAVVRAAWMKLQAPNKVSNFQLLKTVITNYWQ